MTVIIDYGIGNLFSLVSSLSKIEERAEITSNADKIKHADRIILPGVGAFSDAIKKLKDSGLDKIVINEANSGKPLLGICLGMQLLFDKSYEYGEYEGLGLIEGTVEPIAQIIPKGYKIPHIGWNMLILQYSCPILQYCKDGDHVYFVHSYYAKTPDDFIAAKTEYGANLTAVVQNKNIFGCQFHPEKSGNVGLSILKAFCEVKL